MSRNSFHIVLIIKHSSFLISCVDHHHSLLSFVCSNLPSFILSLSSLAILATFMFCNLCNLLDFLVPVFQSFWQGVILLCAASTSYKVVIGCLLSPWPWSKQL